MGAVKRACFTPASACAIHQAQGAVTAIAVSEARAPPDHRPGGAFLFSAGHPGIRVSGARAFAMDVAIGADGSRRRGLSLFWHRWRDRPRRSSRFAIVAGWAAHLR
jgi:hypothetical protein